MDPKKEYETDACFARPKSAILIWPLPSMRTLAVLRSLNNISLSCKHPTAMAISAAYHLITS